MNAPIIQDITQGTPFEENAVEAIQEMVEAQPRDLLTARAVLGETLSRGISADAQGTMPIERIVDDIISAWLEDKIESY